MSTPRIPTLTLLAALLVGGPSAAPVASAEGEKTLRITGLAQVDYRTALEPPPEVASHELNLRRARINFEAGVTSRIRCDFQLQGDGANIGSASLIDAYVDFLVRPGLTLRAGQNKYEFDFEAREGDSAIPLLDRSFASNAVAGSLNGLSTANITGAAARDRGLTLVSDFDRAGMKWRVGGGAYQGSGRASDDDGAVSFTLRAEAGRGPARLGLGYLRSPHAARANPGFNQGVTLLDDGRGEVLTSGKAVGTVLIVRWQVEF